MGAPDRTGRGLMGEKGSNVTRGDINDVNTQNT
jgi:hypothetical protein